MHWYDNSLCLYFLLIQPQEQDTVLSFTHWSLESLFEYYVKTIAKSCVIELDFFPVSSWLSSSPAANVDASSEA